MADKVGGIYYDLDLNSKNFNTQVNSASGKINSLKGQFEKVSDASKMLAGKAAILGAAVVGIGAKALSVASKFETMGVSLETAFQGNKKAAADAQKQIVDFTAKTPFELDQVMGAFVKLKNMGLDPSQNALRAYGDTASAMGKSLNDMVEAVADASTGEFERLKEFGIRSSSEGDKVKFTFQGVSTTVGKNSKEIEKYLINLGKTKFGGGMEKQSKTLEGKISNLKDAFNIALSKMANDSGLLDLAKGAVDRIISAMDIFMKKVNEAGGFIEFFKQKIVEFQAPLIGLATAITVALIPAIISWVSAAAPLIGLVAVAAAIGFAVYKVIDAFGGFQKLLDALKPVIDFISNAFMTGLMPALQELWKALTDLWALVSPVLLPVLKFLGIVVGVIIVGAIWLLIQIIKIIVKVITMWVNNTVNGFKLLGTWVENLKGWFAALPENFRKTMEKAKNAIIEPLKKAFDWIKEKVQEAKDSLNRLNPFHRESPSLVDWIRKGTTEMTDLYGNMFNDIDSLTSRGRLGLLGASQGLSRSVNPSNGTPMAGSSVTVNINPSGIIARSRSDLREISSDIMSAINEDLRARGMKPIGETKIR